MSYLIGDDFYKSGLPELFDLEEAFSVTADDADLSDVRKYKALNACLQKISELVDEKRENEPAYAMDLVEEAVRFVSEPTPFMARGLVQNAFALSASGQPTLHSTSIINNLDKMRNRFEEFSECSLVFSL